MPTKMRQKDRDNRIEELRLISRRKRILESLQRPSLSLNSFLDIGEVRKIFSIVYEKSDVSNEKVDFYFYDRATDTMLPREGAYKEALAQYIHELHLLESHGTLALRENLIWFIVYENNLDALQLKLTDLIAIASIENFNKYDDEIIVSSLDTREGICLLKYEYKCSVSRW